MISDFHKAEENTHSSLELKSKPHSTCSTKRSSFQHKLKSFSPISQWTNNTQRLEIKLQFSTSRVNSIVDRYKTAIHYNYSIDFGMLDHELLFTNSFRQDCSLSIEFESLIWRFNIDICVCSYRNVAYALVMMYSVRVLTAPNLWNVTCVCNIFWMVGVATSTTKSSYTLLSFCSQGKTG